MSKKSFFRQSLFLGLLLGVIFARGAISGELLPNIEARRFESKPIQKSSSGRVYLFTADRSKLPNPGVILLVHDQDKPILAFRVLRSDSGRGEFAAKKIRRYDQAHELEMNHSYLMMEKVADVISPPASENAIEEIAPTKFENAAIVQNTSPIQENITPLAPTENTLAPPVNQETINPQQRLNVNSFDSELDGSGAPEEDYYPSEIEERIILNPFDHSIGAMIGSFRNLTNISQSSGIYSGFGMNYAQVLARDLFASLNAPQDAVNIEFGFAYYTIQNIEPYDDAYTMMPLTAQFRYDLQFSNTFALFVYGGLQYNFKIGATNELDTTVEQIQGIQPTVGGGMLYTLGPHWFLRVDLGWDKMAAGLTLEW